jgi:GNAT superfamily N-acetyltransferase
MTNREIITFRPYLIADKTACLDIFDANCPASFAPGERDDYIEFLGVKAAVYEVCLADDKVAGAFGLIGDTAERKSLRWILIDPSLQGKGIGRAMMGRVMDIANKSDATCLEIAASHRSASFFAKFGAESISFTDNGWGPNMHRIDMELLLHE